MRQFGFKILLVAGLLGLAAQTFAQFGGNRGGGGGGGFGSIGNIASGNSRGGSMGSQRLTLDTSEIYFFFADEPNLVFPFGDSLLSSLHQYDPIRQRELDFASLGNLGSAARPLLFQPTWRRGFDVGLHQFDIYQMQTSDVRYYKIEQAYTQAGYSQGPTQADALFDIKFSRNFADGLNLSLEHRRINNAGAYDFQKATNSDVAFGLWYHNPYGNYDGFFSFVTNSVAQQNNGGAAESLTDTLVPPFQVLTNLENSNTRYANKEVAYTQYFYLNRIFNEASQQRRADRKAEREAEKEKQRQAKIDAKNALTQDSTTLDSLKKVTPPPAKPQQDNRQAPPGQRPPRIGPAQQPPAQGQRPATPDSLRTPPSTIHRPPSAIVETQRVFTLYHQIAWRTESHKFSDTSPDSTFYGDFLVDSRGLRHYLERRKLENTFKLQTFKLRQQERGDTTDRALPRESDLLEVGLVHSVNFLDMEPVDTQAIHNLFLTGRLNFSPGERLRVQTYAHLGVGANAGDFRLSGELFLNFKKIGNLRLEAVNQLYTPSLMAHRFYISEKEIWKNNFAKTLETSLSGTYSLPFLHFSVTGQYHLLNNLVYFGTDGRPRQAGAFSILQLMARKDFHFGPVHLENWAALQQSTSSVLPLPGFYSKHSLYFEKKIFKKVMLTKIGFDARLATGYTPPGYQPLTGQFHLQNEQALGFTPLLDAFLSFRVKTFRFFFKIENLLTFPTETYYYQTAGYPLPFGLSNGGMRLGVNWRLVD